MSGFGQLVDSLRRRPRPTPSAGIRRRLLEGEHTLRRTFTVVSLVLLTAMILPGVATTTALARATPAAADDPGPTADVKVRDVTLPTGDELRILDVPGGRESVAVRPPAGRHGTTYSVRRVGRDLVVVPAVAEPFIGRGLDLGLFDVDTLPTTGHAISVHFSGSTPSGVTSTSAGHGYLTDASAPAFGRALAARIGALVNDRGTTSPPTDLNSIGANTDEPVAPQPVHPDYDMRTVKVRVLDGAGAPAQFASVQLMNADDSSRYNGNPLLDMGQTRVSVPVGDYSAIADIFTFDTEGVATAIREVSVADIKVVKNRTLLLDGRTAVPVTAKAPRRTVRSSLTVKWQRGSAAGGGISLENLIGPGIDMYEAPTDTVKTGTLDYAAVFHLDSPSARVNPYSYDLAFPATGAVAAMQRYRPTAGELATLNERYFTDVPGRVAVAARTVTLADLAGLTYSQAFPLPLRRREYVTANPAVVWQDNVAPVYPQTPMAGPPRTFTPGSRQTVDWFRGPLVPGFDADAGAATIFACPACRTATALPLRIAPTVDSTAGHAEVPFLWGGIHTVADEHLILSSGRTILADTASSMPITVKVTPTERKFDLVLDETRVASWIRQSTASHTEWTFTAASPTATRLPATWTCAPLADPCAVLPLLTASYRLGVATDGTAPAGPDTLDVTIRHLPGATATPITSAAVRVSFDDGVTWTPTGTVDRGAGHYRARWTNPASTTGGDVAIKVTATDAAGGTFTQISHHAYTITAAGSDR